MNVIVTALLVLSLWGQKELDPSTPDTPERIRVLAIHATNVVEEESAMDPTLAPLRDLLESMPFNTFREIAFRDVTVPYGVDTAVVLNDVYTLHCTPQRVTESAEVVFEAHIDMVRDDAVLEALRVTGRAERGKGMVFRGFALDGGEMVVVLSVARSTDGGDGGAGSGDSQAGEGEAGQSGTSETPESNAGTGDMEADQGEADPDTSLEEEEEKEREDDATQSSPAPAEDNDQPALPPELANLEGILQALEAIDQREQSAARARRFDAKVRGNWW